MSPPAARLLVLALLVLPGLPAGASAQAPADTTRSGIGLHLAFPDRIAPLRLPGVLLAPGRGRLGAERFVGDFTRQLEATLRRDQERRQHQRLLTRLYASDTLVADAVGVRPEFRPVNRGLFGLSTSAVDVVLDGSLTLEISTDRFENRKCSPFELQNPLSGCRPKWGAPRIDNTLLLRLQAVIGQRVYVDIDLETTRDYANSNTIRAYYQGLPDEFLKRIDVGTVRFRPPASRFLTAGIPSNNFGAAVTLEYGPLEVQTLAATQKGSVLAERTYRIGDATVEPQDRLVRDLDFETGRFYWVVNPRSLPGHPRIDPLTLDQLSLPATVRPREVRIYRYRAALGNVGTNPNLGGITALGRNTEGEVEQQVGPLKWELLTPGEQYWLDPSGLWFVLTTKLDPDDFLAISYTTDGDTRVGTFPATDNPAASDSLLLVAAPNQGPALGTFAHAMRNVYRVAGSDLQRSSLEVAVLLNRSERPVGDVATWLSKFGLAIPTDQAIFDIDNRLFPRVRDPGAGEAIRDRFVVFPNLEPFGDPQLVVDPAARNDSLYRIPEYLLFSEGPPAKFQLRLRYASTGGGDKSTLLLNAQQIREETEEIFVDGRRVVRGIDYSINYETGLVSFLDPEGLFGTGVSNVRARFEQRGFFAVAPTSIFGLTARYALGDIGSLNLVGLYQSEATAFNRPPLGFEPSASLIGGVSTSLKFDLPGVSRFVDRLVAGEMTARSTLDVEAEVAFSRPDPNRSDEAYLEEFEDDQGIPLSLRENAWQFGSMPASAAGLEPYGLAAGFDSTDAVQLIWQNLVPDGRGGARELRPTDIDTNIVIRGSSTIGTETVLYMTFHADTAGGIVSFDNRSHWSQPRRDFRPRWRSMVTPISLTGRDLSRNEFLEFWVFQSADRSIGSNQMQLVVDLGTVSEDALAIAPAAIVPAGADTSYTGRQYPGAGFLDTERSPTGTFNATTDDRGILADRPLLQFPDGMLDSVATCRRTVSNVVDVYPWGDLGSRCTSGNGILDTEDLDGDLLLDARGTTEDVFRYVVDLDDPRYFVRSGQQTVDPNDSTRVAGWSLYRIPLREVDRTIGQPNIRLVKHLRFTFVTPPDNGAPDPVIRFALARMRLVGAPWIARADAPILGLEGSIAQPRGAVTVTSISTENVELGYVSPPGLGNTLNDVNAGAQGLGVQVNEKSLRTVVADLRAGERAEAYTRLAGGAQSLLAYREMRVWARGRGEGWEDGRLRAYVKVGTDDRNFYYYEQEAGTASWVPEMVIDIEKWRALRAEVETRFLRGDPPGGAESCGGDPEAWVACDGGYVVHVRDPAINPPNLAAVQEVATGIRYLGEGGPILATELWTDDIRLTSPITEVGVAMAASARLQAGDLGSMSVNYVSQDGNFRQIGQAPSYRTTRRVTATTSLQLGRFLSPALGLTIPLTMILDRSAVDPELITGSDVRGADLAGLRRPSTAITSWRITARRTVQSGGPLTRWLVNPVTLTGNWQSASAVTEYSETDNTSWGMGFLWDKQFSPAARALGLGRVVDRLPRWLAQSAAGRGIANGQFRYTPSVLRFQSTLSRTAGTVTSFTVPITEIEDTLLLPTRNLQHLWQNGSTVNWRPLGMLNLGAFWQSTRDLREYPDSTTLGRLVGDSRRSFLGLDAGVERDRLVTTTVAITPTLASWLRPRLSTNSSFVLSRNLTSRNPVRVEGDTAGAFILPQTLNNSRTRELGLTAEPATLMRRLLGDSSGVARYFSRVRPIDASWSRTWSSTYDLAAFDPGTGYQLATGSFEDFLYRQGSQAVGAAEIRTARITGAMDLPVGLSVTGRYGRTDADRYQRAAGDQFVVSATTQYDWPDVTVRWSAVPRRGPISFIQLATTVLERDSRTLVAAVDSGGVGQEVSNRTSTLRPEVDLQFRNGIGLRATGEVQDGERLGNGNITQRDARRLTVNADWYFRLPSSISPLRKQLQASLLYSGLKNIDCLVTRDSDECVTIADVRRKEYSGTLSADVVGSVRGSFSVQYVVQELRHLERETATLSLVLRLTVPLTTLGEF